MTDSVKVPKKTLQRLEEVREEFYNDLEKHYPELMEDKLFLYLLTKHTSHVYAVANRKWEEAE